MRKKKQSELLAEKQKKEMDKMVEEFKRKMRKREEIPDQKKNTTQVTKCPKEQILKLSKKNNLKELYLPGIENKNQKKKMHTLRNSPILSNFTTQTGMQFDTNARINSNLFK